VTTLLLASGSPRRRELFALLGIDFDTIAPQVDETRRDGESPTDYAHRLSLTKAEVVLGSRTALRPGVALLAADTIVVDGDDVLGKPRDEADAWDMLRRLRGRTHEVCTAVVLWDSAHDRRVIDLARSPVRMRAYTDAEMAAYIASGDPMDKAGAYGIQNPAFHPVEGFAHCFANVMGLPVCHVARGLRELGIAPPPDIAARCQAHVHYDCPVFGAILGGRV
jgi:septum formation protein